MASRHGGPAPTASGTHMLGGLKVTYCVLCLAHRHGLTVTTGTQEPQSDNLPVLRPVNGCACGPGRTGSVGLQASTTGRKWQWCDIAAQPAELELTCVIIHIATDSELADMPWHAHTTTRTTFCSSAALLVTSHSPVAIDKQSEGTEMA